MGLGKHHRGFNKMRPIRYFFGEMIQVSVNSELG